MGLTDSPYNVCQAVNWSKGIELGYRKNLKNNIGWEKVVSNFRGKTSYDCQHPRVYKDMRDGLIKDNLFVYVDDGRPIGPP